MNNLTRYFLNMSDEDRKKIYEPGMRNIICDMSSDCYNCPLHRKGYNRDCVDIFREWAYKESE